MDQADKEMARMAANAVLGATLGLRIGGQHKGTWDPVVPADVHKRLPPVAPDGTVECSGCAQRVSFANANIANECYVCAQCAFARNRAAATPLPENVTLAKPKTGMFVLLGIALMCVALFLLLR